MKVTAAFVLCVLAAGLIGCDTRTPAASMIDPDIEKRAGAPGTNAGSNNQLTDEVAGWSYGLAAGHGRIAGYQFNESGTVVATVGQEGRLDYPALFWKINEHDQIVIADDREFEILIEVWTIISIDDPVVTVSNAIHNREETYIRNRHWPRHRETATETQNASQLEKTF